MVRFCSLKLIHHIEMAKTEEIRDGLFSISWTVQNFSSTTPSSQVNVDNLQAFSKSCSLACKLEKEFVILELKNADRSPASLRGVVVSANYGGVKHNMTLNGSTWIVSWNWTSLAQCNTCEQHNVNHNQGYYGRQSETFNQGQYCSYCGTTQPSSVSFEI